LGIEADKPESPSEIRYDTLVGTVIGAHGVQGAFKVRMATPTGLSLIQPEKRQSEQAPRPFVLTWIGESPDSGKIYRVISAKRQEPSEIAIVKVAEINNRDVARTIFGQKLYAPEDRRAPLEADEYFVSDLIGLAVVSEAGVALGTVTNVLAEPASDIYETDLGVLIPAVKEFVVKVDLVGGQILVRDIEGLAPDVPEADAGEPIEAVEKPPVRFGRRRFGAKR